MLVSTVWLTVGSALVEDGPDGFLVLEIDPGAHAAGRPVERLRLVRVRGQRGRQQLGDQSTQRLALALLAPLQLTQDSRIDVQGCARHAPDVIGSRIRHHLYRWTCQCCRKPSHPPVVKMSTVVAAPRSTVVMSSAPNSSGPAATMSARAASNASSSACWSASKRSRSASARSPTSRRAAASS